MDNTNMEMADVLKAKLFKTKEPVKTEEEKKEEGENKEKEEKGEKDDKEEKDEKVEKETPKVDKKKSWLNKDGMTLFVRNIGWNTS